MLLAADVLTWCQTLLLTDTADLARAEPKIPRYRLLHTAAPPPASPQNIKQNTQRSTQITRESLGASRTGEFAASCPSRSP